MRTALTSVVILLALATQVAGAERKRSTWKTVLFRSSQAALLVANSLDIGSSWEKREMNPLLRNRNGTFGARGTTLKLGMMIGALASGELLSRRSPQTRPAIAIMNFGMAAFVARQATHNLSVPRARRAAILEER